MVTRQHQSKARRDRRRPSKAPGSRRNRLGREPRPSEHVYGVPVPEGLHEAIESERDNLSKAESLLACMVVSMEYATESLTGPYFPAVAQMARELVARSIDGLDPFVLQQRLVRNKIEEEFHMSFVDQPCPLVRHAGLRQTLIGPRLNG